MRVNVALWVPSTYINLSVFMGDWQRLPATKFIAKVRGASSLFKSFWRTHVQTLRIGGAFLLLTAVVCISVAFQAVVLLTTDDGKIQSRLRVAIQERVLGEEDGIEENIISPYGYSVDMFTECIALGTNLATSDRSLLYRLAATPAGRVPGARGPCQSLVQMLRDG